MEKRFKTRYILLFVAGIALLSYLIYLLVFFFTPRVVSTTHVTLAFTDFDTFLDESTLIVHGKVGGNSDGYSSEETSEVYTDYYITPLQIFRGSAKEDEQITLRLDGGTIGNAIHEYPQEAKLEEGKEYLFIANTPVNHDLLLDREHYYLRYMMFSAWEKIEDDGTYFESMHYIPDDSGVKSGVTEINGQAVQANLVPLSAVEKFSKEVNARISPEETIEKLQREIEERAQS